MEAVAAGRVVAGGSPAAGRWRVGGLPPVVLAAIVLAWAAALTAHATDVASAVHHDSLLGSVAGHAHYHLDHAGPASSVHATAAGAVTPVSVGLYTAFWVVMVAAMMLPSAWPLMRLFTQVSAAQPRPGRALAAFVGGYLVLWTGFGIVALVGDLGVHAGVETVPWLSARPWLVGGATLALAGGFQFSGLKERCLTVCRTPGAYLLRHYRRGTGAALALGWDHGVFCLGCCWALMLVMFAAGVSNGLWMAALAAVMAYEKVGRRGAHVASAAGVVLLVWAAVVALHPPWLPAALALG